MVRRTEPQHVYALVHPLTGHVGYVGVTANIRGRYLAHLKNLPMGKIETFNQEWVRLLRKQGLLPLFRVLETTDFHNRFRREEHWITYAAGMMPCTDAYLDWVANRKARAAQHRSETCRIKRESLASE